MKIISSLILCITLLLTLSVLANSKKQHDVSGIRGETVRIGFPPESLGLRVYIANCVVVIRRAGSKREFGRVRSDTSGHFRVALLPGKYVIVPLNPNNDKQGDSEVWPGAWISGKETAVTVQQDNFKYVYAVFDGGW